MLCVLTGTRPDIIKLAPVLWELSEMEIPFVWVHSGQHFDHRMSGIFFDGLVGKRPDFVIPPSKSIAPGDKISHIRTGLTAIPTIIGPLVVLGDTLTTLAGTLWAKDRDIPVIHVEAGLRSGDIRTPEELIRITVDNLSELLLATTERAMIALSHERSRIAGISKLVGNTIVDAIHAIVATADLPLDPKLKKDDFTVLTIHRSENLANREALDRIISAAKRLEWMGKQIVFPVHPHTEQVLDAFGIDYKKCFETLPPQDYREFLGLLSNAALVMTDSGSIQEEAYLLNVPCATFRAMTERQETVEAGANILIDPATTSKEKMEQQILHALKTPRGWSRGAYGSGAASAIIREIRDRYGI